MGYQSQSSGNPWLQGTLSFLSSSFRAHSLSITNSTPSFPATTVGISQDPFSPLQHLQQHTLGEELISSCAFEDHIFKALVDMTT